MESGHEETEKYVASKQEEYGNVVESESGNVEDNIVTPRESDEIIVVEDYVSLWENYTNDDAKRWYQITGRIYSINEDSLTVRDGLPDKATAFLNFNLNSNENLSGYREGDEITLIGFSNSKMMNSIYFDYCQIVQ